MNLNPFRTLPAAESLDEQAKGHVRRMRELVAECRGMLRVIREFRSTEACDKLINKIDEEIGE